MNKKKIINIQLTDWINNKTLVDAENLGRSNGALKVHNAEIEKLSSAVVTVDSKVDVTNTEVTKVKNDINTINTELATKGSKQEIETLKTNKIDDVIINGNNLKFFANGTEKKNIVIPSSSGGSGNVDLSNYYTKNEVDTKDTTIKESVSAVDAKAIANTNKISEVTTQLETVKSENISLKKLIDDLTKRLDKLDGGSSLPPLDLPIIPDSELPSDFPKFTFTGKSDYKGDFYLTPHNDSQNGSYIFITNNLGQVKWYKKVTEFAYSFRRYMSKSGKNRFTYHQVINKEVPKKPLNGGYDNCELVILDEKFTEIERIRCKASGRVESNYPLENHDYVYIDDGHYIVTAYHFDTVDNIPNVTGSFKVVNCVIQEIKNGEILLHWESCNHLNLYSDNCFNKSYTQFPSTQGTYNDYAHLNSIFVDERDNNLLASFRHIGLMKIDRKTGNILWIMGRNKNDINGCTNAQTGYLQHDARYNYDNSITIFDNSGCSQDNTRICRYWINEETKTITRFKEYIVSRVKTPFMGSATLLDDSLEVFDIAGYGSKGSELAFHEYNFSENKEVMKFKFNSNDDTYRIFRDWTNSQVIRPSVEYKPVQSINLDKLSHTFKVDETVQLSVNFIPSNATNKEITWTCNNSNATVVNGLVTAKTEGSAIITATSQDGNKTATCNLTIQVKDSSGGGGITVAPVFELNANNYTSGNTWNDSVGSSNATIIGDVVKESNEIKFYGNQTFESSISSLNLNDITIEFKGTVSGNGRNCNVFLLGEGEWRNSLTMYHNGTSALIQNGIGLSENLSINCNSAKHKIIIRVSKSELKCDIYVDDIKNTETRTSNKYSQIRYTLFNNKEGNYKFIGGIEYFKIYNKALNDEEIRKLFLI